MKNGIDRRTFATALRAADPAGRRTLTREYRDWVFRGAKEQGWYASGGILLGGSVFATLLPTFDGSGFYPIWLYLVCGLAALLGAALLRVGFRKERDWRRANPFFEWKRPDH